MWVTNAWDWSASLKQDLAQINGLNASVTQHGQQHSALLEPSQYCINHSLTHSHIHTQTYRQTQTQADTHTHTSTYRHIHKQTQTHTHT